MPTIPPRPWPRWCRTSPSTATPSTSSCSPGCLATTASDCAPRRSSCSSPSAAPPALQPVARAAPRRAVAARPPGAALRAHRLHRGRGAPGADRARGLGAHALRYRLPAQSAHLAIDHGELAAAAAQLPHHRRPAPAGHRVRRDGRSLEHPRLRRPVQPLPGHRKQQSTTTASTRLLDLMSDIFDALRAPGQRGRGRRRGTPSRQHALRAPRRPGPVVGPVRQHRGQSASKASPATRPGESAEAVAAALAGLAQRRGRRRRPGLLAPPRRRVPLAQGLSPWSSRRCWNTTIRSPPWRCWCSGSARPTRSRWSRTITPSTSLVLPWMEDLWTPQEAADGAELSRDERWRRHAKVPRLPRSQRRRVLARAPVRNGRRRRRAAGRRAPRRG